MEFDNSFEVPLPPADTWKVLLDIKRIAPCMPGCGAQRGAERKYLQGQNQRRRWRSSRFDLRRGGEIRGYRRKQAQRARIRARDRCQGTRWCPGRIGLSPRACRHRLKGARAYQLRNLSGQVAQYGRGVGIIQATAAQLINQFAKCLKEKLAQEHQLATAAAAAPPSPATAALAPSPPDAKPISGFALMAKAMRSWIAACSGALNTCDGQRRKAWRRLRRRYPFVAITGTDRP